MVEQWNSGNTVIFYGKDGDLTGPDREHTEVSMLVLLPRKGRFGLIDYEKAFCGADIFEARGISRDSRCVVVVRPDQYVSAILQLDAHDALSAFFAGILR